MDTPKMALKEHRSKLPFLMRKVKKNTSSNSGRLALSVGSLKR
jgi:hypothetical protein